MRKRMHPDHSLCASVQTADIYYYYLRPDSLPLLPSRRKRPPPATDLIALGRPEKRTKGSRGQASSSQASGQGQRSGGAGGEADDGPGVQILVRNYVKGAEQTCDLAEGAKFCYEGLLVSQAQDTFEGSLLMKDPQVRGRDDGCRCITPFTSCSAVGRCCKTTQGPS
jgi:hypothetical protein